MWVAGLGVQRLLIFGRGYEIQELQDSVFKQHRAYNRVEKMDSGLCTSGVEVAGLWVLRVA